MRIMVTNGGTHSPQKWAEVTSATITDLIKIDPASVSSNAVMARNALPMVRDKLRAMLEAHHELVQEDEKKKLAMMGLKRLADDISPTDYIGKALADVNEIMRQTMFAEAFNQPQVQNIVFRILGQHFADVQFIERDWVASKRADSSEAIAFYAKYRGIAQDQAAG